MASRMAADACAIVIAISSVLPESHSNQFAWRGRGYSLMDRDARRESATFGIRVIRVRAEGGGAMEQDPAARRAIAKAAWRLLPFLCLCYAVNFLDRVNVG